MVCPSPPLDLLELGADVRILFFSLIVGSFLSSPEAKLIKKRLELQPTAARERRLRGTSAAPAGSPSPVSVFQS